MESPKLIRTNEVHEFLKERHPELFKKPYRPFAIGIDKQILDKYPFISPGALRVHLKNITNHPLYLTNFLNDRYTQRLNLDLTDTTVLTEKERTYAFHKLRSKMKKFKAVYLKKLGDEVIQDIEVLTNA